MSVCPTCSFSLEDDMNFCPNCGAHTPAPQVIAEKERHCLYVLRRNLRHERTVWAVFAVMFLFITLFYIISSISSIAYNPGAAILSTAVLFVLFLLPLAGTCLYEAIHLTRLERSVFTDCSPAVQRANQVCHIVLGAIFGEFSWVFAMLNLIHVKNNKALLEQIIEKQKSNY